MHPPTAAATLLGVRRRSAISNAAVATPCRLQQKEKTKIKKTS
jgi:hypothetical protein